MKGIPAETEVPNKIPVSSPIESEHDMMIDEQEQIRCTYKTNKNEKCQNKR